MQYVSMLVYGWIIAYDSSNWIFSDFECFFGYMFVFTFRRESTIHQVTDGESVRCWVLEPGHFNQSCVGMEFR